MPSSASPGPFEPCPAEEAARDVAAAVLASQEPEPLDSILARRPAAPLPLSALALRLRAKVEGAEVERRQLEAGTYWSSMRHLLAFMCGQRSSTSMLRWLPGELLTKIARQAIRQNSRLVWAPLSDSPTLEVGYWRGGTTIALMPGPSGEVSPSLWLPQRRQIYYVELSLDDLWCGSGISCHSARLEFTMQSIASSGLKIASAHVEQVCIVPPESALKRRSHSHATNMRPQPEDLHLLNS